MDIQEYEIDKWFICEKCEKRENARFGLPDRWMLMKFENEYLTYCPCAFVDSVENAEEVDGSGYTAGGTAWNPSTTTTTTWNPGAFSIDMYTYPPLKKGKPNYQEKLDAVLAEMEEEKAEQERRWKAWEETKHSKHMDPTCERCVEEIERIKRELRDYGKGNSEEK
jgi:hypothetical protein